MADSARPPVAIRIVRPYETEEAFLEAELETVGKTSVILIGAHSRPTGVILRFEVTLASGAVVLRGEGRVLAYKDNAFRGQPGLALRFTRLDPKSKALVDRAGTIREARLSGEMPAVTPSGQLPSSSSTEVPAILSSPSPESAPTPSVRPTPSARPASIRPSGSVPPASVRPATVRPASIRPSAPPDPGLAEALTAPTPTSPPVAVKKGRRSSVPERSAPPPPLDTTSESLPAPPIEAHKPEPEPQPDPGPGPTPESSAPSGEMASARIPEPPAPPEPAPPTSTAPSPNPSVVAPTNTRTLPAPTDRDDLLARLRQRAASMTDEKKASILGSS